MRDDSRYLPNTEAYLRFRRLSQGSFDFAVVVCFGVPALKRQISLLDKGVINSLPDPDHFKKESSPPDQLREQAKGYKARLAAYTLITNFSFFESFVVSAVQEMIDFHGGADQLQAKANARDRHFIELDDEAIEKHRRVLRAKFKNGHEERFEKHSRLLQEAGFRFPSELFSSYGTRMLLQKLGNLRAVDIPDLLRHGLHMKLDDDVVEEYHNVREIRNRIAHGDPVEMSMRELSKRNRVLRDLSYAIDRHINKFYMLNEDFVPG